MYVRSLGRRDRNGRRANRIANGKRRFRSESFRSGVQSLLLPMKSFLVCADVCKSTEDTLAFVWEKFVFGLRNGNVSASAGIPLRWNDGVSAALKNPLNVPHGVPAGHVGPVRLDGGHRIPQQEGTRYQDSWS